MVQRFSVMHESFFNPDDKGQFVSYHDYAALERERDELLQKVQVLENENALLRKRLEELGKLSPLEQTARSLREGE
jgi:hypothetical protein